MQINPNEVAEKGIITNIAKPKEQIQQVGIDLTLKEDVELPPKGCVNVELAERFDMQDTFGLIKIRSSLSRKGIFESSGIFDPGFRGVGGITLYNLSEEKHRLPAGFRVCQMVVFKARFTEMYNGFYNKNQTIVSQYSGYTCKPKAE